MWARKWEEEEEEAVPSSRQGDGDLGHSTCWDAVAATSSSQGCWQSTGMLGPSLCAGTLGQAGSQYRACGEGLSELCQPLGCPSSTPTPVSAPGQTGGARSCHGHGGVVSVLWECTERLPEHPSPSCRLPGEQLPALLLSEPRPSPVSTERSQGRLRLLQGDALGSLIALGGESSGNYPESSLGRGEPGGPNAMQALLCSAPSAQAAVILAAAFIGAGMRLAGAACASRRGPAGPGCVAGPSERGWGRRGRAENPPHVLGRCCF